MTLSFSVAELGSSYFSANNGSASGAWANVSSLVNSSANLYGAFSPTKSYTVKGILSDKFSRTEFTFDVGTESVVMSIAKNGIGFQKFGKRVLLTLKEMLILAVSYLSIIQRLNRRLTRQRF